MTNKQFQELSFSEKARWLYFNGHMVTSIRYYKHKINLYELESLLIEVFYNHAEDRVDRIEILDTKSKRMQFYADQVKLPVDLTH